MALRNLIGMATVVAVLASCGRTWTCDCYAPNAEPEYEVTADSGEQAILEAEKRCFDAQKGSTLWSAPILVDTPAGQVEKPSTPISMAEPCSCTCRSGFSKVYSE